MKTPVAAAVAVVAGGLFAGTAMAQVDAAAEQVLQDSAAAIKNLDAVSYSARRFYKGEPLEGLLNVSGDVKILRLEEKPQPAMWLSGEIGVKNQEPTPFTIASDGESYSWLEKSNNTLYERPMTDRRARQQADNINKQVLMDAYIEAEPYAGALKAESLTQTGVEEIHGVLCNVIEAATADGKRKTVYHIGVADLLPRREAMVNVGTMNVAQVLEIQHLEVNPKLTLEALKIDLPEGYVVDRFVPQQQAVTQPQQQTEPAPEVGLAQGTMAPDFTLSALSGGQKSLKDYSGNVVVLTFWGPVFAKSEACLNMMQELHSFFEGKEIKFVAVACREQDAASVSDYVQQRSYTFDVLTGGSETAGAYKLLGFPSVVVVSKSGSVSETFLGCPSEDDLLGAVERAAK